MNRDQYRAAYREARKQATFIMTFPIGQRLQQDMQRMFAEPASVTGLRDERIKRNREASERKFDQRHGLTDFNPDDFPGAA